MYGRTRRQLLRRRRSRFADVLPVVTFALLVAVLLAYGYKHWLPEPLEPVTGRARVADGDSIEIAGARIRLEGIDAPELHQTCTDRAGQVWPCGRTAADELRSHIAGRELTCRPYGVDRYQRLVAACFLADGSDVNAWLVRQGWAVAYGRGTTYHSEQSAARSARRGIWSGSFTPPSEWRRQHE
jgi:endonuclease YncB( thermonuclease family)